MALTLLTSQEHCLLIPRSVIESSDRPATVVGSSPYGKSRLVGGSPCTRGVNPPTKHATPLRPRAVICESQVDIYYTHSRENAVTTDAYYCCLCDATVELDLDAEPDGPMMCPVCGRRGVVPAPLSSEERNKPVCPCCGARLDQQTPQATPAGCAAFGLLGVLVGWLVKKRSPDYHCPNCERTFFARDLPKTTE